MASFFKAGYIRILPELSSRASGLREGSAAVRPRSHRLPRPGPNDTGPNNLAPGTIARGAPHIRTPSLGRPRAACVGGSAVVDARGDTYQQEKEGKSHVGALGRRESSPAMGGENATRTTARGRKAVQARARRGSRAREA